MTLKKSLSLIAIAAVAAMAGDKSYSGAELYTNDTWMYGKYEARMQMAATSGTVSSMFLYHNDSYKGGTEPWVEVDIEILGKNPSSFQSNIITGYAENKVTSEAHHAISPASNTSFHTYGMEWTPKYVAWTLDGVVVRKTERGQNDKNQVADLEKKPQGLRFNLWSALDEGWVGAFNDNNLPVFQFINWVKVYKYTPGQGENGSDFTLDWADDFNTFNESRWSKADWTFAENRVDLTPSNIYVKDGMLILALTKKGQEAFNGQVPVDNEASPVVTPASSASQQQPTSSASQQQPASSAAQPTSSVSVITSPVQQTASSASTAIPVVSSSASSVYGPTTNYSSSAMGTLTPVVGTNPNQTSAIQKAAPVNMNMKKTRGTFNAKGAKVSPKEAGHYRVDFDL